MTRGSDFTNLGPSQITQRRVAYDTDNMPTQVWAQQSGVTTYFSYDGDGDRVKKTTTGGATVYYAGDHYEVKNDEPLKYIFAGNLRLIMIKGINTFYYHKDHLNSTSVMTDNSGTVVETVQYEPFGATRDHTGTDMSGYKFTDQELDNETNLYNYDARLYDPVIGRFGTADNIVQNWYDPQSLNAYAYCRNNPLIYTDPTGHITTGEQIDKWAYNAVSSDNAFKSYVVGGLLTFTKVAWGALGAESASKVYDNLVANRTRNDLTATDGVFATVEVATALLPGVGKLLSKGGKVAEIGFEAAKNGLKEGFEIAAEAICFTAGTKIHTRGGLKSIEEIGIDDEVLSRNEQIGEIGYRKVTKTFITANQEIYELNISSSDGKNESFKVTGAHPFYERYKGWTEASNLLPGDEVFTSEGGWLQVSGGTWLSERQTVYNFEVEDFHTYFVGGSGIWVHNKCSGDELHHLLPQAKKLKQFFEKAGLNIEDFKILLDKAKHRLKPDGIHTGSENWNRIWGDFIKENAEAGKGKILKQLKAMRKEFDI